MQNAILLGATQWVKINYEVFLFLYATPFSRDISSLSSTEEISHEKIKNNLPSELK